jgi:predicted transport protein
MDFSAQGAVVRYRIDGNWEGLPPLDRPTGDAALVVMKKMLGLNPVERKAKQEAKFATNFKDIAIELWEVRQYENDTIAINAIKKSFAAESIKPLTQNKEALKKVTEEIKVYTEDEHLQKASELITEIYQKFRQGVLQLADDIEIKPKKMDIGFRKDSKVFTDICILKNSLKIWINLKKGKLDDPKQLAEDVSEKGHWGNGDYQIQVETDKDLEYIMSLVKQSLIIGNK